MTKRDAGDRILDIEQLDARLSEPTDELIAMMGRLDGDILVLGVGGKMGPSLARMARRASDAAGVRRRVIGAARFSAPGLADRLRQHGIETVRCDLLNPDDVAALPDAKNVVFMAGMKFGTTGQEALTWAMNVVAPGMVARRFAGSRIVVFSTGNVYPLTPVEYGGSRETDLPAPVGEYANSCLGRERVFQYYCEKLPSPTAIIRLNYANEMRYGVLVDLAQRVWNEEPIDLTMGYVNVIWQGDANAMILRALEHVSVPAAILNVVGPETLRVRRVCEQFAQRMGKTVRFVGKEAPDALLSNGLAGYEQLGWPRIGYQQLLDWVVDWVVREGETLAKPTLFEARDGRF
ncbi:MAG: NAD(P)-dependent oxidoreductase [Pirellulales bacterium]|nr:NAD(P)-dependent oxidoreductase [Pirellulales bacterium]